MASTWRSPGVRSLQKDPWSVGSSRWVVIRLAEKLGKVYWLHFLRRSGREGGRQKIGYQTPAGSGILLA